MNTYNVNELISKLNDTTASPVVTAGSSSKLSFGVVNSEGNGKRISISKALSAELDLTEAVELLPCADDGVLIIGAALGTQYASTCALKGKEKKIGYSAAIVHLLTKVFALDFSDHVSVSFSDIQIQEHDDAKVAIINMRAPSHSPGDSL